MKIMKFCFFLNTSVFSIKKHLWYVLGAFLGIVQLFYTLKFIDYYELI